MVRFFYGSDDNWYNKFFDSTFFYKLGQKFKKKQNFFHFFKANFCVYAIYNALIYFLIFLFANENIWVNKLSDLNMSLLK